MDIKFPVALVFQFNFCIGVELEFADIGFPAVAHRIGPCRNVAEFCECGLIRFPIRESVNFQINFTELFHVIATDADARRFFVRCFHGFLFQLLQGWCFVNLRGVFFFGGKSKGIIFFQGFTGGGQGYVFPDGDAVIGVELQRLFRNKGDRFTMDFQAAFDFRGNMKILFEFFEIFVREGDFDAGVDTDVGGFVARQGADDLEFFLYLVGPGEVFGCGGAIIGFRGHAEGDLYNAVRRERLIGFDGIIFGADGGDSEAGGRFECERILYSFGRSVGGAGEFKFRGRVDAGGVFIARFECKGEIGHWRVVGVDDDGRGGGVAVGFVGQGKADSEHSNKHHDSKAAHGDGDKLEGSKHLHWPGECFAFTFLHWLFGCIGGGFRLMWRLRSFLHRCFVKSLVFELGEQTPAERISRLVFRVLRRSDDLL